MAAERMQFPWRCNGDPISLNLGVIWEMSDEERNKYGFHTGHDALLSESVFHVLLSTLDRTEVVC